MAMIHEVWIDPPDGSDEPTKKGWVVLTSQGMIFTMKIVEQDPEAGTTKPMFAGTTLQTLTFGGDVAKEIASYLR